MRATLLLIGLLLFHRPAAHAGSLQFASRAAPAALLELFTSEGCSSCPPAETWLSQLKDDARLWKDFIPVAFHVDYWDRLGWKDPFASKAFTTRQHRYAAAWRSQSVYTPGFVLNGVEWRGWFQRERLPRAGGADAGVLTAASDDARMWRIGFQPAGTGRRAHTIHAALLGFDLVVNVKAGENQGRNLQHDFVVLALTETALAKDGDSWRGELKLNPPPGPAPHRTALAAWVTAEGSPQPIQALGGWLAPADSR
jgi:hypothetical protein